MTIVSKQSAKLLVPKSRIAEVRDIASQFNQKDASTVTNGFKAIMHFDHVESDPIWLLDMRRAGIPYVWFWGADALKWRYADASKITAGRGHTVFNTGSDTKSPEAFKIACGDFVNFEFDMTPDLVAREQSRAVLLRA